MIERETLFRPDWAIVKRPEIALLILFGSFVVASILYQAQSSYQTLYDLLKSPAAMNVVLLGILGILCVQIRNQNKVMRGAEYLRLRSDLAGISQTLIQSGRHEDVYNELARRTRRRLVGWSGYSRSEKITYLYINQVYGLLERTFEMREKGWIEEEEWNLWERWIDNTAYHPLFSHVYEDNREMFPRAFEDYIRSRLSMGGTGTPSAERVQEDANRADRVDRVDRDYFVRKGAYEDKDVR
jgi:hypothetical protein